MGQCCLKFLASLHILLAFHFLVEDMIKVRRHAPLLMDSRTALLCICPGNEGFRRDAMDSR